MKTVAEHIRAHLLSTLYFPDDRPRADIKTLQKTQWCDEYETYRRNRMVMGYFRYGDINRADLDRYDLPAEAIKRIQRYQQDHNLEHLVDAGNITMLAYMQGKRSGKKFISIDDGEHSKPKEPAHESNMA